MLSRHELDHMVLDVELVLISVVQGVALTTLAVEAVPMLRSHHWTAYVFVATGLLFVLSFWSAALIHAISFVEWPMDLIHYFFYFGLALMECLTFAQMERSQDWFAYTSACFVIILALYVYDYRLIVRRRSTFENSAARRRLYGHVRARQRLEMLVLIPIGLAFNLAAALVTRQRKDAAMAFAVIQLVLTLTFVINFVRSFTACQKLIETDEE